MQFNQEEKGTLENLSPELKDAYIEQRAKKRQVLMIKTIGLTSLLLECFDELETLNIFRHRMKKTGNPFLKTLEKYINDVYDVNEKPSESNEYLAVLSNKINKLIEEEG